MKTYLFALATFLGLSGVAFAQSENGNTISIENDDTSTISDLSTREERLNVEPLDWDVTRGKGLRTDAIQEPEGTDLTPGSSGNTEGGAPVPDADEEAKKAFPEQWEGLGSNTTIENTNESGGPGTLGTKDVFSQYCENCDAVNLSYPMKTIGKLFTNSGSCSASVVSPNNVIVTAAHCCYNRSEGDWIRGWRFAPAYRDGFSPYGLFDWQRANVPGRWISTGDRKSDVCVIKLRNNNQNRPVTFYTGWLGRSWNHGTTQLMHWLGYPGNIGGGNKKQLCVSESFNPSSSCGGSSVLNAGCSMTFGASGGPAVRSYRGGNWVNSVVSGYDNTSCTGSFGKTFNGPRFTSDNIVQICDAIGC